MRKILLSLTAASAIVAAASIAPASAMTVGTASGIQAAIDGTSAVEDVAYVCRHRYMSSRRVCWWRPGGFYRPYRRWRRW
jgi:phage terminase large subunit-like protein